MRAVAGLGLDGDRYFCRDWVLFPEAGYGGREVTLIEIEAVNGVFKV